MSGEEKKIREEAAAQFLAISSIGRPYEPKEIPQIFEDMKKGLAGDLPPAGFSQAIGKLGSHAPKIVSPRAGIYGLNFPLPRKNSPAKKWVSGNGALGSHGKVLCRPIAIAGEPGQDSFIDRILSGCPHAPALERAFENSFGKSALDAVKEAISQGLSSAGGMKLHGENFPVFYLPGPGRSDLQASPGGYVDAFIGMNSLRREFRSTSSAWWDAEKDRQKAMKAARDDGIDEEEIEQIHPRAPMPPQPAWIITAVSDKMQNAAIGAEGKRSRLFVRFPDILDQESADIWRFVHGGAFPPLRDPELPGILVKYASLLGQWQEMPHKPDAMTAKLDKLADAAIRIAGWHIDDVRQDVEREHPQAPLPVAAPPVFSLLARVRVKSAARDLDTDIDDKTVAGAMRSKHFASRLKLKGYAE